MNERFELSFLGANATVTGSRHLLEAGGARVLVDCGLFQGYKTLRLRNWAPFPVPPASIDAIVLTHGHLDHCGYLPRLAKDGFRGRVWCTPATRALCRIMLPDSGRLQEEEAGFAQRKGSTRHSPPRPLYTEAEAIASLDSLEAVDFGRAFEPAPGLQVHLQPGSRFERATKVHRLQRIQRGDGLGFGVERSRRAVAGAALALSEAGFLFLQPAGVRQHDAAKRPRRGRAPDPSTKSVLRQPGKVTAVVEVPVGQDDGIDAGGRHRERGPVAQAQGLVALEEPAVHQHPRTSRFEQVARTGHGGVGAEEGQFEALVHLHLFLPPGHSG